MLFIIVFINYLINCSIAEDLITVVNNRDSSNWNIDDGYASQTNAVELYPYRVFGSGSRDSMHVRLFIPVKNEPMACRDFEQGARLWLHAPDSLPQISDHYINIPIEQDISISVKPIMTKTLAGTLSSYSLHRRNCYFHSERRLRFFKIYNQKNCELECLANYTNSVCKCVKFYMPSKRYSWSGFTATIHRATILTVNYNVLFGLKEMIQQLFATQWI